jgi:hypothetical protein
MRRESIERSFFRWENRWLPNKVRVLPKRTGEERAVSDVFDRRG